MKTKLRNEKLIIEKEIDLKNNVNLRFSNITELPDNLKVSGSLDIEGTAIKKEDVPKHLINKCRW